MWRAILGGAIAWLALSSNSFACIGDPYFLGIAYYESVPANLRDDQVALDIIFDEDAEDTLNGVATAHVRRVLLGAYDSDTVRIRLGSTSCTRSFQFGREGIVVGHFWSPSDNDAAIERVRITGDLVLISPITETVLVPNTETRADRDARIAEPSPNF